MSVKTRTTAQAEKAARQRIRMLGNRYSRTRKTAYGSTTVEEGNQHGTVKDFTAWKRNKLNKE